jgi:hypothetical protein
MPTGNPTMAVDLPPMTSARSQDRHLAGVRRLASILDQRFVDPILGLVIPGAGDVFGSILGLYTIGIVIRRRVSPIVIARMLLNLGGDALLGVIPFLGDLFDFGFKANLRNVALLENRAMHGGRARPRDWLFVIGAAVLFVGSIALAAYAAVSLVRAIL